MLIRLILAIAILSLIGAASAYFWADIEPLMRKYKDTFGSIANLVSIALPVITLLIWVFKPRQPRAHEKNPSAPLFKAGRDVVVGDKQENHYH